MSLTHYKIGIFLKSPICEYSRFNQLNRYKKMLLKCRPIFELPFPVRNDWKEYDVLRRKKEKVKFCDPFKHLF